jgi:hypothetical protein
MRTPTPPLRIRAVESLRGVIPLGWRRSIIRTLPPLLWTQKQDVGPQPRAGVALAYDGARGRTVLFGGTTLAGAAFGDTWEWDGTDWTQVADTGPVARSGHALAYDANRSRVVLFGGAAADGSPQGDTWEWDGDSWTQVEDTGPDARQDLQFAFDANAARCVLFGGLAAANALRGDTWLWDGTNWTQAQDTGPAPRRGHAQTYDAVRSEVVLFGGDTGSGAVGDTWAWDGEVWTQRAHFGPPPSASAALVFDGTVALLYGGGRLAHRPEREVVRRDVAVGRLPLDAAPGHRARPPVVDRDGVRRRQGLRSALWRGRGPAGEPDGIGPPVRRHVGGAGLRTAYPGDRADGQPRDRCGRRCDRRSRRISPSVLRPVEPSSL